VAPVLRLIVDPDVVAKRVGDAVALVQLRTNRIYTLNRTGARVWELVADGCGRDEIEQRLLEEFDVAEVQLHDEIEEAIATLLENELILRPDGSR